MPSRRWAAAVTMTAVAAALTGCGGDDGSDVDLSAADPGRTPVSDTTSDKLAGYEEAEVAAYREAVRAFKRNLRVDSKVYAEGKATPQARRELAKVFAGEALDFEWEALRDMDADDGRIVGTVRVIWTKPMRILVDGDEGTVDLRSCLDRSDVRVFRAGKPVRLDTAKRAVFKTTLDLGSDGAWRVSAGEELGRC